MNDFKPLGLQISESLRAYTDQMRLFQNPMIEAVRQMKALTTSFTPPSVQLAKQLQKQFKSIVPIDYGIELAKALKPYNDFTSEFAKTQKLFTDQIKFQIPEIKIPIGFQLADALRQSSILAALQAIRHNQVGEIRLSQDIISRINEISSQVRTGEEVNDNAIDGIIQTLNRIEDTLYTLQNNLKTPGQKLLTIEDIRFYIGLIVSLVLFLIPYTDQLETDDKIEKLEEQTINNSDRLEQVNDKLDKILDLLAKQEKWICSRDTHLRLRPRFKSGVVTKILQFETVVIDNPDSVNHKWIKVKFIDTNDNEIRIGWVSKKYFKKI